MYAYKKSFELAIRIFELTKSSPKEETYSLTDQIRRASQSVSINISEANRKRVYPKLTDSDAENSETQVWLDYSFRCDYINKEIYMELISESEEVDKLHA